MLLASSEAYITSVKASMDKDEAMVTRDSFRAISEKDLDEWYLDVFTKCFGEDLDAVRRDSTFAGDEDSMNSLVAAIRAGRYDIITHAAVASRDRTEKRFDVDAFIRGQLRTSDMQDIEDGDDAPMSAARKSLSDATYQFTNYVREHMSELPDGIYSASTKKQTE